VEVTKSAKVPAPAKADASENDESDSASSDNAPEKVVESSSESDSDDSTPEDEGSKQDRRTRESPPPPDTVPLPPLIDPSKGRDETALKEAFRKRWMSSMADAFASDLEQIRKASAALAQSHVKSLIVICRSPT
jgi:hypothetical protein